MKLTSLFPNSKNTKAAIVFINAVLFLLFHADIKAQSAITDALKVPSLEARLSKADNMSVREAFELACYADHPEDKTASGRADRFMEFLAELDKKGIHKPATEKDIKTIVAEVKKKFLWNKYYDKASSWHINFGEYNASTAAFAFALTFSYYEIPYRITDDGSGPQITVPGVDFKSPIVPATPESDRFVTDSEFKSDFMQRLTDFGLVAPFNRLQLDSAFARSYIFTCKGSLKAAVAMMYFNQAINWHKNGMEIRSNTARFLIAWRLNPVHRYWYWAEQGLMNLTYQFKGMLWENVNSLAELAKMAENNYAREVYGTIARADGKNHTFTPAVLDSIVKICSAIPNVSRRNCLVSEYFIVAAEQLHNKKNFKESFIYFVRADSLSHFTDSTVMENLVISAANFAETAPVWQAKLKRCDSLLRIYPHFEQEENFVNIWRIGMLESAKEYFYRDKEDSALISFNRYRALPVVADPNIVEGEDLYSVYTLGSEYYMRHGLCQKAKAFLAEGEKLHPSFVKWPIARKNLATKCK
jgi:tetratricopeptide (TPR) repeat protein